MILLSTPLFSHWSIPLMFCREKNPVPEAETVWQKHPTMKKRNNHILIPLTCKKKYNFKKKNIARVAIRHVQQGISVNYMYILYFIISLQGTVSPDGYFFKV